MTHVVVIGAGPAGISAAREAQRLGARTTVVDKDKIGGRATWASLLPSKAWLTVAAELLAQPNLASQGFSVPSRPADFSGLSRHVTRLSTEVSDTYQRKLRESGVDLVQGTASFLSPGRLRVVSDAGTLELEPDRVIVATGSVPRFLPGAKPDPPRIIAPRLMARLTEVPHSVIVVGAGATGVEFAHLFGSTLLVMRPGLR